jgi:arylsulfatase A-like enzyme
MHGVHGGIESLENHSVGTVPDSPLNSENAPLRGEKNTLWEGGMRVCAFANWPGRLEPRKCKAVMHVADWFPTIARLVGWSPPQAPAWDGLDRWDAITGVPEAQSRPRPVCVVHPSGRAVIGDRWKLIVLDTEKKREESLQLYDLLAAGDAIPEAALSLHVYDPDASKRFILLNGQRLREGEMTGNGLRVRGIVPDGVVLDHRGVSFKVPIEP